MYVPVNLVNVSDESADRSIRIMAYSTAPIVLSNGFHYLRKIKLGDVVPLLHKTN